MRTSESAFAYRITHTLSRRMTRLPRPRPRRKKRRGRSAGSRSLSSSSWPARSCFRSSIKRKARRRGPGGAGAGTSVTVEKVEVRTMDIFLDALGTVTPQETVNVYNQVTGRFLAIDYGEGQIVQQSQVPAEIDPAPRAGAASTGRKVTQARQGDPRAGWYQPQTTQGGLYRKGSCRADGLRPTGGGLPIRGQDPERRSTVSYY